MAGEVLPNNLIDSICFARIGFTVDSKYTSQNLIPICPAKSLSPSRITILSDSSSWLNAVLPEFIGELWQRDHSVRWIHHPSDLVVGDVCFMLSCGRLLSEEQLSLHRHNLVVHASDLPKGQGWSPMSWQILEGASKIPVTLFEAVVDLDSGPIYLQQQIELYGHELVEEWRTLLAKATNDLAQPG